MMIYDFGLSKNINTSVKLKQYGNKIIKDYARIINAFLSKIYGWGEYYDAPTKKCEKKVQLIEKKLIDVIREIKQVKKTPKDIFKYILNDALIPFAPLNMFMENKPANATIINKAPYKID